MILDIHTHKAPPQSHSLVNIRATEENIFSVNNALRQFEGQSYSIGLHPWDITVFPGEDFWQEFENVAKEVNVKAIGECGVDLVKPVPMYLQLQVFNRQIEIAEKIGKPVLIHAVKGSDIICGLRRDLKPKMPWAVHGFRGKPQAALQLIKAGCYLSFGENFNSDTLNCIPEERILAETDESALDICQIIGRLSQARGKDLRETIERNSFKFLNFTDCGRGMVNGEK